MKFQQREAILKIAYNKAKGNILGLSEYSKLLRMQTTKLYFECYSQKNMNKQGKEIMLKYDCSLCVR